LALSYGIRDISVVCFFRLNQLRVLSQFNEGFQRSAISCQPETSGYAPARFRRRWRYDFCSDYCQRATRQNSKSRASSNRAAPRRSPRETHLTPRETPTLGIKNAIPARDTEVQKSTGDRKQATAGSGQESGV
jgi:hypothetical protein